MTDQRGRQSLTTPMYSPRLTIPSTPVSAASPTWPRRTVHVVVGGVTRGRRVGMGAPVVTRSASVVHRSVDVDPADRRVSLQSEPVGEPFDRSGVVGAERSRRR